MLFLYLMSNRTYFEYFKMFKMAAILGFGRVFKPEVVREVESNSYGAMATSKFDLLFDLVT